MSQPGKNRSEITRLSCISSFYHIIMHFFEKYVRIKIEDHKILILRSKVSPKLDEVNTNYQLLTAVDVQLLIVFLPGCDVTQQIRFYFSFHTLFVRLSV